MVVFCVRDRQRINGYSIFEMKYRFCDIYILKLFYLNRPLIAKQISLNKSILLKELIVMEMGHTGSDGRQFLDCNSLVDLYAWFLQRGYIFSLLEFKMCLLSVWLIMASVAHYCLCRTVIAK